MDNSFIVIASWLVVFYVPSTERSRTEMAHPFTVPCVGHEARFLHCSHLALAWQSITLLLCHASSTASTS